MHSRTSTCSDIGDFTMALSIGVKKPLIEAPYSNRMNRIPPELDDTEFAGQVLQSEEAFDSSAFLANLMTKAAKLGIVVSRTSHGDKRKTHCTSGAESSITTDTSHARTVSTGSHGSGSTTLTSPSIHNHARETAVAVLVGKRKMRSLSFAQYDKYLAQIKTNLDQPKFLSKPPAERSSTASIFSASSRKSFSSIKTGLAKFRKRSKATSIPEAAAAASVMTCSACREDVREGTRAEKALEKLPCGHRYCVKCLRIMVSQSMTDESKMPPRCCTQPIPGTTIRLILAKNEQTVFLKAVLQFSTPWEARIFCSNTACGEFIPLRSAVDPRRPFQTQCLSCQTQVCVMCKRDAHPLGQDCPDDWEMDAVLKMGERSGWRRCYKCRTLVELAQGCTHMTCRCRAQFCYICGAVWDPSVGCPNLCNGEAEMERRRAAEEEHAKQLQEEEEAKKEASAKEAAAKAEADKRTLQSSEFQDLRTEQVQEMDRFCVFERKSKWLMWTRHAQQKMALVEKHTATIDKMKDRHAKTAGNLEDRQVTAEMELRTTLEQSERNIRVRLKHMEAYCDGLGQGQNPSSVSMPCRTVTERDLRELGQQYNVEKNMKQLHQAKINVMRDRQAKALEELLERQETELTRLIEKNSTEVEELECVFADEEDLLVVTFNRRRSTIEKRWSLAMEILQKELGERNGVHYSVMEPLQWAQDKDDDPLTTVDGLDKTPALTT